MAHRHTHWRQINLSPYLSTYSRTSLPVSRHSRYLLARCGSIRPISVAIPGSPSLVARIDFGASSSLLCSTTFVKYLHGIVLQHNDARQGNTLSLKRPSTDEVVTSSMCALYPFVLSQIISAIAGFLVKFRAKIVHLPNTDSSPPPCALTVIHRMID